MQIKRETLIGLVVVVLIIVLGVFFFLKTNKDKGYSVVYLNTGEVYIGKLSVLSDFTLTDPYLFQVTKDPADPTKNTFQLQPINEALWAPDSIHFIKDNIVFYGPLSETSEIAEALASKK